jgi:ribosomal protein L37AE/L43A
MKKITEIFFEKAVVPLIIIIGTPIATAIVSKIKTGAWGKFFNEIPNYYWYIFIFMGTIWIGILWNAKRRKKIEEENSSSGVMIFSVPFGGYIDFAEIELFKVKWRILLPAPDPYSSFEKFDHDNISPKQIEIDTPPRCPKCGTELEERRSFFGKYNWNCVGCGFNTKNSENYYAISEKVKKIVKRQFEKKIENKLKDKKWT